MNTLERAEEIELLRSLIEGVATNVPEGGSERDVITLVSRPLWEIWCRMTDLPKDTLPSDWKKDQCARIYGSETILVDSSDFFAVSFACR